MVLYLVALEIGICSKMKMHRNPENAWESPLLFTIKNVKYLTDFIKLKAKLISFWSSVHNGEKSLKIIGSGFPNFRILRDSRFFGIPNPSLVHTESFPQCTICLGQSECLQICLVNSGMCLSFNKSAKSDLQFRFFWPQAKESIYGEKF